MVNKYDDAMERIGYYRIGGGEHFPPSVDDIRHFEQEIGYSLPDDYKTFLLKYGGTAGGGITRFGNLDNPDQEESSIGVFYGLGPSHNYDLLGERQSFGEDLPPHLLPIASSPGGQIVLSLSGGDLGKVYWWSPHRGSADPYDDLELIAYNFDSFVNSLRSHET